MDEAALVAALKQNISQAPEPIAPVPPPVSIDEPSSATPDRLDELTLMQLHQYLGVKYEPHDNETRKRVEFIFEAAARLAESKDYWAVSAKVGELETMLGLTHNPQKVLKLWLWLKLNQERVGIERQMRVLGG